jgi:predicted lactoylglutathione lyase
LKTILFNISKKDLKYSKNFLEKLPKELMNDYTAEKNSIKIMKERLRIFSLLPTTFF